MKFSWKEYQSALNVIKTFDKEREEIKQQRRNFNWARTYDDIIWGKRIQISNEEYAIRNLSKKRRDEIGENFFIEIIASMKNDLLKIRFKAMEKKKASIQK